MNCFMCGEEVPTADGSEPIVCSEACEEQWGWVLAKGPPFEAVVTQPRNDAGAKRQKTR